MRVTILSPHRDDAAFSCGLTMYALLQAGAQFTVVNVFTQSDYAVDLRTVDPSLPAVEGVSLARLGEDERFLADIAGLADREPASVQLVDLEQLDAPLRLAVRTEQVLEAPLTAAEVQQQATDLAARFAALPPCDLVFAPLALGDHIDHRIVRQAARLCHTPDHVCFYEDLPYAARLMPTGEKEQRNRATAWNCGANSRLQTLHVPGGPHLKQRFAMHYPSQIAPVVAAEMASYAAQWSRQGSGAERWRASAAAAAAVDRQLQRLPGSGAQLEEQH